MAQASSPRHPRRGPGSGWGHGAPAPAQSPRSHPHPCPRRLPCSLVPVGRAPNVPGAQREQPEAMGTLEAGEGGEDTKGCSNRKKGCCHSLHAASSCFLPPPRHPRTPHTTPGLSATTPTSGQLHLGSASSPGCTGSELLSRANNKS